MALGIIRGGLLTASALFAFSTVGNAGTPAQISHQPNTHHVSLKNSDRSLDVLYDQTDNDSGTGTSSQNGGFFSTQAADDFTVPEGARWAVSEVDVIGKYFNGYGPVDSVEVIFYKAKGHKPGKLLSDATVTPAGDNDGTFTLKLASPVKLKAGHYWVSVIANMDFTDGGEWNWENQTTTEGDPAVYRNLGGGDCADWTSESKCFGAPVGDLMFTLKGKAK